MSMQSSSIKSSAVRILMPGLPQGKVASELRRREYSELARSLENRPYRYEGMDPHVAVKLNLQWKQPCEEMFEYLAENYPTQLAILLRSKVLSPADLTFAAEIAGRANNYESVRSALLMLLEHEHPVVREGAIYGVARHMDDETRRHLLRISQGDGNSVIRQAALDTLEACEP